MFTFFEKLYTIEKKKEKCQKTESKTKENEKERK